MVRGRGQAVLRAAGRAGGWLGAFAAGSLVATLYTLFLAWVLVTLWAHGHRDLMAFLMVCGGVALPVGAPFLAAVYLHERDRETACFAVGISTGVLVLSAFAGVMAFGCQDSDQQALHDRGVARTGVVTGQWRTDGPEGATSGIDVRLPDGTTHRLPGEQSPVGTPVVVTVDPRGDVDTRLGPPPGAPDGVGLKLSAAGVALGCMAASASCAGLVAADLRHRLRRRTGGPGGVTALVKN